MKFRDYLHIALATFVAALLIKLFVLDAVIVTSPSMERTLLVGDLVLVNKLVDTRGAHTLHTFGAGFSLPHLPLLGSIDRGDVIVFRYPGDRDEDPAKSTIEYVKRCAGMPGDTVAIRGGELFINGRPAAIKWKGSSLPRFPRDYTDDRLFPRGAKQNLDFFGPVIIPGAGDVVELNARTFPLYEKLIREEGHAVAASRDGYTIDGKPAGRYTVGQNYLFVLGDNNYESSDSRFWGFLPEENVIGKATLIYWSKRPNRNTETDFWNNLTASVRWDRIGALIR